MLHRPDPEPARGTSDNARMTTPGEASVVEPEQLLRYRFALGITDFLICRSCGVYVAAVVPVICGAVAGPPLGGFSIATVFGFGALVYVLSLALGALFGFPIFMLLARLRLVRWWAALIGGFVIGALIAASEGGSRGGSPC